MTKTCGECKHYLAEMFHCQKHDAMAETHNTCEDCTAKTITNGDKIRQMSNEELAKLIDNSCKACKKDITECDADCINGILAWLNAPAESEGGKMSNKRCNVCANPMEVWGYSRMDEHTIFKCLKCGNEEVVKDADISLPKHKQSLFDRITQSPETLAEKLVYCEKWTITSEHPGKGKEHEYWTTPFVDDLYPTMEEAIAATVAKLKEVPE